MRGKMLVAVAAVVAVVAGGAQAQAPGPPPEEKGVKARNLITSLGGFRGTANVPIVLTGQIVEIAPGGQTGRMRHNVPSYIYVLEGTLVTNSYAGPIGTGGVQYPAAGPCYMDVP